MIPKQEFTAHSAFGSFPVPPLPAFSKKNLSSYGVWGTRKKEKERSNILLANRKNEKYINDLGNAGMFKRMLLIHFK